MYKKSTFFLGIMGCLGLWALSQGPVLASKRTLEGGIEKIAPKFSQPEPSLPILDADLKIWPKILEQVDLEDLIHLSQATKSFQGLVGSFSKTLSISQAVDVFSFEEFDQDWTYSAYHIYEKSQGMKPLSVYKQFVYDYRYGNQLSENPWQNLKDSFLWIKKLKKTLPFSTLDIEFLFNITGYLSEKHLSEIAKNWPDCIQRIVICHDHLLPLLKALKGKEALQEVILCSLKGKGSNLEVASVNGFMEGLNCLRALRTLPSLRQLTLYADRPPLSFTNILEIITTLPIEGLRLYIGKGEEIGREEAVLFSKMLPKLTYLLDNRHHPTIVPRSLNPENFFGKLKHYQTSARWDIRTAQELKDLLGLNRLTSLESFVLLSHELEAPLPLKGIEFPHSLKILSLPRIHEIQSLPNTLETLVIRDSALTLDDFKAFPASLQKLEFWNVFIQGELPEEGLPLLATLKIFQMNGYYVTSSYFSFLKNSAVKEAFKRHLERLEKITSYDDAQKPNVVEWGSAVEHEHQKTFIKKIQERYPNLTIAGAAAQSS